MAIVILLAGIVIGMVACVMLAESLKDKPKNISMERSIKKRITVIMWNDVCFVYKGKVYEPSKTKMMYTGNNTVVGTINEKYQKR